MSNEIPEGWKLSTLGVVTTRVASMNPEAEPARNFGYVDISAINRQSNMIELSGLRTFVGKDAPSRARRPISPGDVLFSNVRTNLRNVALVSATLPAQLCSTGFTVLRANGSILPAYLLRWVLTDAFIHGVSETQTGTHYPATSDTQVLAQTVAVPPLAEQYRIVEKVEALLEQVNRAKKRLNLVPLILKRFRQAVLAGACSGGLTREWRDATSHTAATKGEADIDDDGLLSELPTSWRKVRLGSTVRESFYGPRFSSEQYSPDGVPTVRTSDMDFHGRITLDGSPRVNVTPSEMKKFGLIEGDLVVTRTGATIGKCALYSANLGPAMPSAYLIRFRFDLAKVRPEFALRFLQSPFGQSLLGTGQTAVAQPNVNAKAIEGFPLPLPPLSEQDEIIRVVRLLLSQADAIERSVRAATTRANQLPQAILSKGFSGELVPTEAELARLEGRTYETAEELLKRVTALGSDAPSNGKGRGRRTRKEE